MIEAKDYALRLKARLAYVTNGIGWHGIDLQTGAEGDILEKRMAGEEAQRPVARELAR